MMGTKDIRRPEPVVAAADITIFTKQTDVKHAIDLLEAGQPVLLKGFYSTGLMLLKEIQSHLKRKHPNQSFKEQRAFRSHYNRLSNLVLTPIEKHELKLRKAPSIGWLAQFYPDMDDFILPFPQVQGLNSAWQWYQNGITIPVLRNKVHPYYGTYFPTRFEHLILFDNWLKRYEGPKKSAFDVGVGSGVLSFQMVKHGFQKVFATDTNPNAIFGLQEFMGTSKLSRKVEVDLGHLFGKWKKPSELIVFNPPWLPISSEQDKNDEAIYYPLDLFHEFFVAAETKLLPEGRLLVLFSNLAQITNLSKEHPIEKELATGGRFVLDKKWTKSMKTASDKTKRDQNWRSSEEVELWVLAHKA